MKSRILFAVLILTGLCLPQYVLNSFGADKIPKGFIDIKEVIPEIQLDIRYFGPHNFVGERVDGYLAPKCILTIEAAEAVSNVQKELEPFSLSSKFTIVTAPNAPWIILYAGLRKLTTLKPKKSFIRLWIREIFLKTDTLTANRATAAGALWI